MIMFQLATSNLTPANAMRRFSFFKQPYVKKKNVSCRRGQDVSLLQKDIKQARPLQRLLK